MMRDPTALVVQRDRTRYSVGAPTLLGALALAARCFAPGVTMRDAILADSSLGYCWPCAEHDAGDLFAVEGCHECWWAWRESDAEVTEVARRCVWVSGFNAARLPQPARELACLVAADLVTPHQLVWDSRSRGVALAKAMR